MRTRTTTEKVKTPFGNLHAHVSEDMDGNITEVAFSSPGKFHDSTVHEAIQSLGEVTTQIIVSHSKQERAIRRRIA